MKKVLSVMLMLAVSAAASAQLKVNTSGKVNVNRTTTNLNFANLLVGESSYSYPNYGMGAHVVQQPGNTLFNIGLHSQVGNNTPINSGRAFGVFGAAGGSTNGYNYGLYGMLIGSQNGAAVVGSLDNTNMGFNISGRYAGYFQGATYVDGNLTASAVVTPSDIRLKENVESLSSNRSSSTLDNLLGMNVISYNYKPRVMTEAGDTAQQSPTRGETQDLRAVARHYGLSAQELQTIYPDLVYEGQDGYLGVNYIELVPILVRSIQELKAEVDALQGIAPQTRSMSSGNQTAGPASTSQSVLYQNTPNPFKEQTVIRFRLADDVQTAAVCIFDMQGKLLKKMPVSQGMESVTVNGYELGEGMFLYSLLVNGQEIDTKRMILSK